MDRFCKSILSKGSGVVGNFKVNVVAWRKKKEVSDGTIIYYHTPKKLER